MTFHAQRFAGDALSEMTRANSERSARARALTFCSDCSRQYDSRSGECPVCAAFRARTPAPAGAL